MARIVLEHFLFEIHGFLLGESDNLLAVCHLPHRRAARDLHLQWAVGRWRLESRASLKLLRAVRSALFLLDDGLRHYQPSESLGALCENLVREARCLLYRGHDILR